jgi:hypothetical protein
LFRKVVPQGLLGVGCDRFGVIEQVGVVDALLQLCCDACVVKQKAMLCEASKKKKDRDRRNNESERY